MARLACIGIDLGTTYSVVAHLDAEGRPSTVSNSLGDLLTPSALLFDDDGVVVGTEAMRASVIAPDRFADCFKRDMGLAVYHRRIRDTSVPPEVLSGFLLQQLKQDAEARIGGLSGAVITVPAFFDESRRKATQDAGRLAGLDVLDIINEPTAAALAFGHRVGMLGTSRQSESQKILVYDLGGGTFDVTILEVRGTQFRAIATDGDVKLGGADFDERLADHLAGQFLASHGVDPRGDPQDAAQLWIDSQQAKHTLSQRAKVSVVCVYAGIRMRIDVTREEFQEFTSDLLQRTETTTKLALEDAGLTWQDIDRILLVGGATRMPAVPEMIRRLSGKEPDRTLSPDEAVAHGAALYAGMLNDQSEGRQPSGKLINVNSHSLGIVGVDSETRMRANCVVVPKNTPLPCCVSRVCVTHAPSQRSVKVMIVEGESHRPEDCIDLGACTVRNLPEGLPKGTPIRVAFSYATNGRIEVMAHIPAARQSARVEIDRANERNLEDLDTWKARLLGDLLESANSHVPEEGPNIDWHNRSSVLRRLDFLYTRIGKAAMHSEIPDRLVLELGDLTELPAKAHYKHEKSEATVGKTVVIEFEELPGAELEVRFFALDSDSVGIVVSPIFREDAASRVAMTKSQLEKTLVSLQRTIPETQAEIQQRSNEAARLEGLSTSGMNAAQRLGLQGKIKQLRTQINSYQRRLVQLQANLAAGPKIRDLIDSLHDKVRLNFKVKMVADE